MNPVIEVGKIHYELLKKLNDVEFDFTSNMDLDYNSSERYNCIHITGYDVYIPMLGESIGVRAWVAKEAQGFRKT